jgi:hypothetical protein
MIIQEEKVTSFFDIIDTAMEKKGMRCADLYRAMKERGNAAICMRTLSRYCRRERIPDYDNAALILDTLGVSYRKDELRAKLEQCSEQKISYVTGFSDQYMRRTVRIKISYLSERQGITDFEILEMLNRRIRDTQGKQSAFSKYIGALIQADLDRQILPNYSEDRKQINRRGRIR